MTNNQGDLTLVERLEAAECGSRQLDYEIREAVNDPHWNLRVPADWSQSLDAALALAERVLPGFHCHIGDLPVSDDADHEPHHKFGALLYNPEPYVRNRKDFMEHGATRPLALCAAILKALNPEQSHGV